MNCKNPSRKFRLFAVFCLGLILALPLDSPSAEKRPIDYGLVRNLKALPDRSPAPSFTLANFEGKKVRLEDFRGQLLMLNFWASWCVPCREEMPAMERLYRRYKDRAFAILGVNLQDDKQKAVSLIKELKLTFPMGFDPHGEVGLLYGAWGLPATYLIGPSGVSLARAWGPADWFSPGARKLIERLLEQEK